MSKKLHIPQFGHPIEHAIVRSLVAFLGENGWKPCRASDGEEIKRTRSLREVLDLVFSVDESAVAFRKIGYPQSGHDVVFVCGNHMDLISDWRYSDGDTDGFNALMDKFTAALDGAPVEFVLTFPGTGEAPDVADDESSWV